MSKKFKSQASSSRAAAGALGGGTLSGFAAQQTQREGTPSSLSYVSEPPDLSQIFDPQVVVAFKSLLKKDSTTKSKALEDLQGFLTACEAGGGAPEDGFLQAWTTLYPRTSIDSSRRVRQLAHTIQGHIVSITGKRVARYISKVIGSWLAGLYDNDKLVQRAAQESVDTAFPTEEKRQGIWTVYQAPVLDFVEDAVLQQTPQTLSDERTVRPDEAEAKHARVVATGIQVFRHLIAVASVPKLRESSLDSLIGSRSLWRFAYHDDAFVRRSLYGLLSGLLCVDEVHFDWKLISTCILSKSLSISQRGSATEFSDLLLNITKRKPQLWTSDYSGKTPSSKRLLQYLKRGSEGALHTYWDNVYLLLKTVPRETLMPHDQDGKEPVQSAISLLAALHEGVLNKEEPRANIESAWSAYLGTARWISALVSNKDDRLQLLRDRFCPVIIQYVLADTDKPQWAISEPPAQKICSHSIVAIADSSDREVLMGVWKELTGSLVHGVNVTATEQHQEYKSSQDTISAQTSRFFDLEAEVMNTAASSNRHDVILSLFRDTTIDLLHASRSILRSRNGELYGAATIISEAANKLPELFYAIDGLDDFLSQDIPNLIFSPSADRLVFALFQCRDQEGFQNGLDKSLDALLNADQDSRVTLGLRKLFSLASCGDIKSNATIESLISRRLQRALQGDQDAWIDNVVFLQNPACRGAVASRLLGSIADSLFEDDRAIEALRGLDRIVSDCQERFQDFATGTDGSKLISKLLYLAESPVDEISHLADSLESRIKNLINHEESSDSTVEIVQQSFREVGQESLSLDSLVAISEELLLKTPPEDRSTILSHLLPTGKQWAESLQHFLHIPPKWSTSLISPLGGAVYLVDRSIADSTLSKLKSVPRDSGHFPLAYRLPFFVTKLLSLQSLSGVDTEAAHSLFLYLPLAIQLIDDDLNVEDSTGVLRLDTTELRDECAELVSEARLLIKDWVQAQTGPQARGEIPSIVRFWEQQLGEIQDNTPEAYRTAETLVKILSEKDALEMTSPAGSALQLGELLSRPSSPFTLPTVLAAYKSSIIGAESSTNLCNRLVADLTALDTLDEQEGLRKMISLNILLEGENSLMRKIPTQRLVFFVKHLIQCLQPNELSLGLSSETLKVLTTVSPFINEIYGSHWSEMLEIIGSCWEPEGITEGYLPVLHSSLRLFACLRGLAVGESNDDLEEAWIEAQKSHQAKLIGLLTEFDQSFTPDLPWNVTADLLARQISAVGVDHVDDVSHVFSALSVQSRGIQRAAYNVLHRTIPKLQETASFNVALSNTEVSLPDELVSLLVDPPAVGVLSQRPTLDNLWIEARCYLLAWKAVFDHFMHASLPVRERYSNNIKEHECLPPLLDFMFDFLQGQRDKPIDVSKLAIRAFELEQSESVEKEIQWLLTHLYYLCLRYLPNLTKAWWTDSRKRVKGPIETWTEKYISPLVIDDSLNDVSKWFGSQDWRGEEQALQVKVSQKSAEIVASIQIDEESPPAAVAISLPPTYPLQQASVTSRSRVVVDEKKWKNWLLTIQGVIMFSNGSLVDGLLAFRRNVQGALKGQGECIICTSVISANMQTPNKRCATCKQTFHSDCLFRWFKTSNSSGCPLCRNPFLYS